MAVLLWAVELVLIIVLAVLLLRERVTTATVTAVAAALVGVLHVIYRPEASGDPRGVVLTLIIAGSYLPLIPVFGLTAGFVAGERLVERQPLGAALVVLAAAVVTPRHAPEPA